jgi:hypothetical protein
MEKSLASLNIKFLFSCRNHRYFPLHHLPRRFMERPQTAGADEHPLAVYRCVLQIRVLSGPVGGVIMGAEQDPVSAHL